MNSYGATMLCEQLCSRQAYATAEMQALVRFLHDDSTVTCVQPVMSASFPSSAVVNDMGFDLEVKVEEQ